jgi:hypothetical protein
MSREFVITLIPAIIMAGFAAFALMNLFTHGTPAH